MFVAIVTAAGLPASATMSASRSCCFAFSTSCLTPCFVKRSERNSDVSIDVVKDFHARYHANQNPTLVDVVALGPGDTPVHPLTEPLPSRTAVTLRASWTADSAESYPVLDPASHTLVDHREAIRVSWFVSAGALAQDRTGRGEADTETFTDDVWTTPDTGPAYLWVVVRDSRGGVAFAGYTLSIAP